MLKQLSINNSKNVFKTCKANILKRIELKKKGDVMYKENITNAIKEGEEYLANGGKTYTLEESKKEWSNYMVLKYKIIST